MTETVESVISVTVLDSAGNAIGTVHLYLHEDLHFLRKRLYELINAVDVINNAFASEYKPIEPLEERKKRMDHCDKILEQKFQTVFFKDDVHGFFVAHSPTEDINGRSYYLRLVEAILLGFEEAMDRKKTNILVTAGS